MESLFCPALPRKRLQGCRRSSTPRPARDAGARETQVDWINTLRAMRSAAPASDDGARAAVRTHSDQEKSFSTWIGMATTLGLFHAVEIRITFDMKLIVRVSSIMTTATTRPSQSSTAAPDAP